ncbi:FxLYD domain-containing protein [Paenibacillus sp. CAU 1782]
MYCHHCIRSFPDDARFCSQCGRRLHYINVTEEKSAFWPQNGDEEAAALESASEAVPERFEGALENLSGVQTVAGEKMANRKTAINWLLAGGLLISASAMLILVYWTYQYETDRNENVLRLQSEAKAAALAGEYQQALSLLAEGMAIRPEFAPLTADEAVIEHVMKLERLSHDLSGLLEKGDFSQAQSGLDQLKGELGGHKEPVYDRLKGKLDDLSMEATLLSLSDRVDDLSSIKEHGEMLNVVNGLIGEEAAALREEIIGGIRSLATRNAETLMNRKNFTGALAEANRALIWVKDDSELLALQQRIHQEQAKYEKAEQIRIEQAMQEAAAEDLINQTEAVKVESTDQTLDEFGDLTIVGVLRNAATRPIYSVMLDYSIVSPEGEVLARGNTSATPNYVEPGEEMTFTATVYGVHSEETEVVIDHVTWYLD